MTQQGVTINAQWPHAVPPVSFGAATGTSPAVVTPCTFRHHLGADK